MAEEKNITEEMDIASPEDEAVILDISGKNVDKTTLAVKVAHARDLAPIYSGIFVDKTEVEDGYVLNFSFTDSMKARAFMRCSVFKRHRKRIAKGFCPLAFS